MTNYSTSDYQITADGNVSTQSDSDYSPSINWSLYAFIVITFIFFYLKNKSNYSLFGEIHHGNDGILSVSVFKNTMTQFLIYFVIVFTLQVSASIIDLNRICPNNESQNFLSAIIYCFGPWVFIFLAMVVILIFFPFVKKAFSDVIGYMVVSKTMTDLFSKILYSSQELKSEIQGAPEKKELMMAEEAIMKIVQDKSVFVNQMTLQNFNKFWNSLKPLMKKDVESSKKELFDAVLLKDNCGELCWYLYTGIFVCFVVAYNVSVKSCKESVDQLKKDFSTDVPLPNSGGLKQMYQT